MRLHTDVHRYFIADALSEKEHQEQVQAVKSYLGFETEKDALSSHLTKNYPAKITVLKRKPFSFERGPRSERMSQTIFLFFCCCIYHCVPAASQLFCSHV